jgi:V/A-type H+/Na+-transporting ATPase subunit E
MADDLQALLERIRRDGIEKAQAEAERILAEARARAGQIERDAEARAAESLKKAEQDGRAFAERGRKAVEQAARDVVLAVGQAVRSTFGEVVRREVTRALTPEALQSMLALIVSAYAGGGGGGGVDVLVSSQDLAALKDFFTARYAEELKRGLRIGAAEGLAAGFRVSIVDEQVVHDFSDEAIAESLCQLLRPHLAEIVRAAVEKMRTER